MNKKELLNRRQYKVLEKAVKSAANRYRVNSDDMLSFVHEKIIPILKRYDDSYGVPYEAYITTNTNFLCKNFLRDEANIITINKSKNYTPIARDKLLRKKPDLFIEGEEQIARELGMTYQQYDASLAQNLNKFTLSLDEHSFLEAFLTEDSPPIGESPILDYLSYVTEHGLSVLKKAFLDNRPLKDDEKDLLNNIMQDLEDICQQDLSPEAA